MPRLVVAHDFICPWCWVARRQAERLRSEFPTLELIWKGYELFPEDLLFTPSEPEDKSVVKPPVPSRFDLMLLAERLTIPKRTRRVFNSRKALEGSEFALKFGRQEAYLDVAYYAYWEESKNISDLKVLSECATKAGLDADKFTKALETKEFKNEVVEYDEPAHNAGVWNVPTWMFAGDWVAETPYETLRKKVAELVRK